MRTIGSILTELIYSRPSVNTTASAIVPRECFEELEDKRTLYGVTTQWWYALHPITGEHQPAFTPLSSGRIKLIEARGIQHCDRFVGTFEVKEIKRKGIVSRELWLVDAQRAVS